MDSSEEEEIIPPEEEPSEEEEIDKNTRLFLFLYNRFIEGSNNNLETMERFIENINSLFEENGSDIKIRIYDEESVRANPEEYEYKGVQPEFVGEGISDISDDLLISLINFLFNIPRGQNIIGRDPLELIEEMEEFNSLAKDIESRVRIISYRNEFEGVMISLNRLI